MAPPEAEDGTDRVGDADLFRELFDEAVIGIAVNEIITDDIGEPVDLRFLAVNDAFKSCAGIEGDVVEGKCLTEVLPGIEKSSVIETCGDVALNGVSVWFEQYARPLDRFYEVSAFPLGDRLFATTLVDITERKERERELERYEAILDGMEDGALIVDSEYRIEYANQVVAEFFEMSLSDLRGYQLFQDLNSYVRNEATMQRLERTLDGLFEAPADGTDPVKIELPLQLPAGDVTVEVHCSTLSLEGGRRAVLIARDVTERKRHKEEITRTNERLDSFAGRLAHELRNPLTVISSRLALARETSDDEHFDHLERSLNRMERLIDDLLVLAREGELHIDTRPVNLGTVATVCWEVIRSPNTNIEIETDTHLLADENRLCQLLEDGFFVEDDGGGIPEEERELMFERGVTDLAHGTGLGLTIVRKVAHIHGWSVTVTDGTDGGARFEFRGVRFAGE